jgi:hypothetical protein
MRNFLHGQVEDPELLAGEGVPISSGLTAPLQYSGTGIHTFSLSSFAQRRDGPDPRGISFSFHRAGAEIAENRHSRTAS